MTLACEDGNSKLVEVVTVVDVDDEKCVDNSLVQIWKVKFGHKVKFFFTKPQPPNLQQIVANTIIISNSYSINKL